MKLVYLLLLIWVISESESKKVHKLSSQRFKQKSVTLMRLDREPAVSGDQAVLQFISNSCNKIKLLEEAKYLLDAILLLHQDYESFREAKSFCFAKFIEIVKKHNCFNTPLIHNPKKPIRESYVEESITVYEMLKTVNFHPIDDICFLENSLRTISCSLNEKLLPSTLLWTGCNRPSLPVPYHVLDNSITIQSIYYSLVGNAVFWEYTEGVKWFINQTACKTYWYSQFSAANELDEVINLAYWGIKIFRVLQEPIPHVINDRVESFIGSSGIKRICRQPADAILRYQMLAVMKWLHYFSFLELIREDCTSHILSTLRRDGSFGYSDKDSISGTISMSVNSIFALNELDALGLIKSVRFDNRSFKDDASAIIWKNHYTPEYINESVIWTYFWGFFFLFFVCLWISPRTQVVSVG